MLGSDAKEAILTLVHGYSQLQLHAMIESLRRTGYVGRFVVFHSQVAPVDLQCWRRLGIETIPSGFWLSGFRESMRKKWWAFRWLPQGLRHRLFKELCSMAMFRHFVYLSFLERQSGGLERVMLTDARDVLFQRVPFIPAVSRGVHVFEEDRSQTLGTQPWNQHWLRYCFGRRMVETLRDEPILCAGIIIGETSPLIDFLRYFIRVATRVRRTGSRDGGGDQAVFNVVVRQSRCPEVRIHANSESAVLTAGLMPAARISFNSAGRVVNDLDEVVPVIHQLDRHSDLERKLIDSLVNPHPRAS